MSATERILLVCDDGHRREFTPDDDGLMWHYETAHGRRWIGWRALAAEIEKRLGQRAEAPLEEPSP